MPSRCAASLISFLGPSRSGEVEGGDLGTSDLAGSLPGSDPIDGSGGRLGNEIADRRRLRTGRRAGPRVSV